MHGLQKDKILDKFLFIYRNTSTVSTKVTPVSRVFNFEPRKTIDLVFSGATPANIKKVLIKEEFKVQNKKSVKIFKLRQMIWYLARFGHSQKWLEATIVSKTGDYTYMYVNFSQGGNR